MLGEESWRRNPGGGILEEESRRRNPGGGILKEALQGQPGGTQAVASGATRRPSRRPLELSGGTSLARGLLKGFCAKFIMLFCQKWRERPFRVDGSEVTCTISAACAQKLIAVNIQIASRQITVPESPPEPLQCEHCLGNNVSRLKGTRHTNYIFV